MAFRAFRYPLPFVPPTDWQVDGCFGVTRIFALPLEHWIEAAGIEEFMVLMIDAPVIG